MRDNSKIGVKMKDIARLANVSVSTVSLALNGKPGVSEATRQKILQIARFLADSYTADKFGHVRKGSIRFLKIVRHGHVLNRDHDVFISSYIDGLEEEARTNGYSLEVNTFVSAEMEDIIKLFRNPSVDGLIVLGTEFSEADVSAFEKVTIPVVFIDTNFDYMGFNFVDMNNMEATFQIIRHFVELGHRKIGLIRSPVECRNFKLREIGFREALRHLGIPLKEKYIFSVDSTFSGAYSDMVQLLKKATELPTALFSSNDIIAYGCIKAIKEANLKVPDDISIVGFDDLPMSALMDPPLTTMKVSKTQIGKTAMRLMIDKLKGELEVPVKVLISGELVYRQSVRKLTGEPEEPGGPGP
ncbi:MAG TPA: LacI family transcriptional regulator [Firmicutes bacterium]|nr:LacI family transcriptional regulator [Bacillota bacterium]